MGEDVVSYSLIAAATSFKCRPLQAALLADAARATVLRLPPPDGLSGSRTLNSDGDEELAARCDRALSPGQGGMDSTFAD